MEDLILEGSVMETIINPGISQYSSESVVEQTWSFQGLGDYCELVEEIRKGPLCGKLCISVTELRSF